jgi:hypothetical protein
MEKNMSLSSIISNAIGQLSNFTSSLVDNKIVGGITSSSGAAAGGG